MTWLGMDNFALRVQHRRMPLEPAGDDAVEAWTDEWGCGGGDWRAFIAIKPRTRWIGK